MPDSKGLCRVYYKQSKRAKRYKDWRYWQKVEGSSGLELGTFRTAHYRNRRSFNWATGSLSSIQIRSAISVQSILRR